MKSRAVLALALVAGLGIAAFAVVTGRLTIRGAGDDDRASAPSRATASPAAQPTQARLRNEIEQRLAAHATGEPVDAATAVAALKAGVDGLLRLPVIDVRYETEGPGAGSVAASGIVRPDVGALDVKRTMTLETGAVLSEERRVVDGTMYVRTDDDLSDVPSPWDRGPVEPGPTTDANQALVAGGAAGASLVGIADFLASAPFTASRAEASDGDGDSITYRLRLPAQQVLEADRARPGATIAFEFTVGPDGVLSALSAYGTVLEDGETLEPVEPLVVDLHYGPGPTRPIVPPPHADLRTP